MVTTAPSCCWEPAARDDISSCPREMSAENLSVSLERKHSTVKVVALALPVLAMFARTVTSSPAITEALERLWPDASPAVRFALATAPPKPISAVITTPSFEMFSTQILVAFPSYPAEEGLELGVREAPFR